MPPLGSRRRYLCLEEFAITSAGANASTNLICRAYPHEAGGGTKTGVITTMGDPFELLRHAQTAYNNDLRPWEQSKEYWDRLKKFCDYSERWRKEQEKDIVWPKSKDVGVVRKGTTEWDVFHELSMKRLKRNGIHL